MTTETTESGIEVATSEGMQRYYRLAKHQAWDVRQLSWGEAEPVPEGHGSKEKRDRRHSMWRSVVTQQLQADAFAVEASTQLLISVPDWEARLYYSTMTQDEARHQESWLRLSNEIGGTCEPDPHLDRMARLMLELDNVEEKVWLFQCAFEGLVIPRFKQIADATPGTILAEICKRLQVDDGIHHGSGVCYERKLLANMPPRRKHQIERISQEMWPSYVEHLTWRPRERAWASSLLRSRDAAVIMQQRQDITRMGAEFGLDLDLPS